MSAAHAEKAFLLRQAMAWQEDGNTYRAIATYFDVIEKDLEDRGWKPAGPAASVTCPCCGAANQPGMLFCASCRQHLQSRTYAIG